MQIPNRAGRAISGRRYFALDALTGDQDNREASVPSPQTTPDSEWFGVAFADHHAGHRAEPTVLRTTTR